MNQNVILKTAFLFLSLAVVLGAFGAHYLNPILLENANIETYKTASFYHFIHALGLILFALLLNQKDLKHSSLIFYLFVSGIIIFSGSLYILSITNFKILGAITPIGGLCFILAWLVLFFDINKK